GIIERAIRLYSHGSARDCRLFRSDLPRASPWLVSRWRRGGLYRRGRRGDHRACCLGLLSSEIAKEHLDGILGALIGCRRAIKFRTGVEPAAACPAAVVALGLAPSWYLA